MVVMKSMIKRPFLYHRWVGVGAILFGVLFFVGLNAPFVLSAPNESGPSPSGDYSAAQETQQQQVEQHSLDLEASTRGSQLRPSDARIRLGGQTEEDILALKDIFVRRVNLLYRKKYENNREQF